jgi:SPP1 gp7 family putative phage head morphogenesis protein
MPRKLSSPSDEEIRAALEKRARRPKGRPRSPRRLPAPSPPDAVERAYTGALRGLNRSLVAAVRGFLARPFEAARRQDDPLDGFAGLDFGLLKIRLGRIAEDAAPEIVEKFAGRIGRWNGREIASILGISLARESPEILAALDAWQRENVALITSIAERLHEDVIETVRDATRAGVRVETLAADLAERYGVSESRAELIARDQTLKANADLTAIRHETAGIERYVWSTSRDERVRPMHADLEGTIHAWDDPPVTNERGDKNHPGGDYQCRCVAIPVLDD